MSQKPVTVLHVCKALGLGGTEKVMQQFVSFLDKSRFSPAVFAFEDGVRGRHLRDEKIPTFISQDLFSVLEKLRPQIVHVHRAGWPEPDLLRPMKLAGTPVVVETNVFGRHDPSPVAAIIDRHLFVSRFCLERFHATNKIPADPAKYDFLYNPVDTDILKTATRAHRDFSTPCAARVSRPDPGKWSRMALDFLPRVIKEIPDFTYRIIGGIPEAEEYVRANGLERNVIFNPLVETDNEIAEFLNNASLMAHANDTGESFGLVIAEAMACGLPVVTHPSEGLRDNAQLELVDHGKTGLVAKNSEEYANAVIWLLQNPEKAAAMGKAGQQKAENLYRAQTVTRKLEDIYTELLAAKGVCA